MKESEEPPRHQSRGHVESGEHAATPDILDEGAGQVENEQVAQQVQPARVQEHVPEEPGESWMRGDETPAADGGRPFGSVHRRHALGQAQAQLGLPAFFVQPAAGGAGPHREPHPFDELGAAVGVDVAEEDLLGVRAQLHLGVGVEVLAQIPAGLQDASHLLPLGAREEDECHQAKRHDPESNPGQAADGASLMANRQNKQGWASRYPRGADRGPGGAKRPLGSI
ncbi:MAG: hypothetical protein DRQ89_15030 [Epsilonproteobacteria bacterium]|nr:MAG: hypothetical protein DRQ89_15030 [Campylobacterota bacterium]